MGTVRGRWWLALAVGMTAAAAVWSASSSPTGDHVALVLFTHSSRPDVRWIDLDTGQDIGQMSLGTPGWPDGIVANGTEVLLHQIAADVDPQCRFTGVSLDLTCRRPARRLFSEVRADARVATGHRPGSALVSLLDGKGSGETFETDFGPTAMRRCSRPVARRAC